MRVRRGARRGYSWHQEDHDTSLQVCPEKDQRPLVHTGAKSQKDQGEVACSCLDSWCRVCVCACVCVYSVGLQSCI